MRSRHVAFLLVLLVLLAAGHFAWWRFLAGQLREGIGIWIDARRAEGWTVTADPPVAGGWPLAARVTLGNLSIARRDPRVPGLRFAADRVDLTLSIFHPSILTVAPHGNQRLKLEDTPELTASAREASILVPTAPDLAWAELHVAGLRLGGEGTWQAEAAQVDGRAEVQPGPSGDMARIVFNAQAKDIALPRSTQWPLGPGVRSAATAGVLNGPFPTAPSLVDGLAAWRDAGGSLELSHLALEWGPLTLNGSATLALDDQLQPMGSGSAKVAGYAEALDRLAGAGVMTKSAATVAKAMLSLLGGGEEPSSVDVPLTLQYRTLSMRQVPLMRLPELDWPSR